MANLNISLDAEIGSKAEIMLHDMGTDLTTVVKKFVEQLVNNQLPLSLYEDMIIVNKKGDLRSTLMGKYKGKIWMSDDFDDPLDEMKDYM